MALIEGAPNTLTAVDSALKQIYEDSNAAALYFDERPGFGIVPKDESMGGREVPLVVFFTRTGGRSASFASAQGLASKRDKKISDFRMTGVDDYSLIRVPGKTLAFARNTEGAFDELVASLAQKAFDDAEGNLANAIELYMYRDNLGWIAQVATFGTDAAGTNSTEATADGEVANIVLSDKETIYFFELGDRIRVSGTKGGVLRSGVEYEVVGVDTVTPLLKTKARTNLDGAAFPNPSTLANSDFIHLLGDGRNAASGTGVKISGFAKWIPDTTPSAGESFFNVDRSASSRLYGKYMDLSSIAREVALIRSATTLAKEGGAPSVALTHYMQQRALVEELGLKREYVDMNPVSERALVANIGYRGVYVQGPHSVIRSIPTLWGFSNEAVLLRPEDWKLLSAGPAISLEDYDGLSVLRLPSEDAYEGRMVFRGNLGCIRPGRQGRVVLKTVT